MDSPFEIIDLVSSPPVSPVPPIPHPPVSVPINISHEESGRPKRERRPPSRPEGYLTDEEWRLVERAESADIGTLFYFSFSPFNTEIEPNISNSRFLENDQDIENDSFLRSAFEVEENFPAPRDTFAHIPQRLHECLSDCTTPRDFFDELISQDFLDQVVLYSNHWIRRHNRLHDGKVKDTSYQEIILFLGVLLLMGVKKRASFEEYWSTVSERLDPWIANAISRDRFMELHSFLHFAPSRSYSIAHPTGLQHFSPVLPLAHEIIRNSQRLRQPGGSLSIDESMVKFVGDSSVKQSMPKKPTPEGFKIWACSDPYDGYLYNFDFYAGHEEPPERKSVHSIVLRLSAPYHEMNRTLFMDKFFTSHKVAQLLLNRGTFLVGALSKARLSLTKPFFTSHPLVFGHSIHCKVGEMYYTAYHARKEGFYLSTGRNPLAGNRLELRNPATHRVTVVNQPRVVTSYHSHAGGVDLHNELRSFIEIDHRARRYYMRLIYYLLAVATVNSYILYSKTKIPPPLHQYVEMLSRDMIQEYPHIVRDPYIVLPLSKYHHPVPDETIARCKRKGCRNSCSFCCPVCRKHFCLDCFWPVHKSMFEHGLIVGRVP